MAQDKFAYPVQDIPAALLQDADEVIRSSSETFEVKSIKEGKLSHRYATTILRKASSANILAVPYDSDSKVISFKAYLYDANGKLLRKVNKSEIKDQSWVSDFSIYEDDRLKYVEIIHHEYPYTVVFDYETSLQGIKFSVYPTWNIQGYGTAVQSASFEIIIPEDLDFYYRTRNIQLEPDITANNKTKHYRWQVNDLPAIEREPYSPPSYEVLPKIVTAPDVFQIGKYQGSMASWQAYGKLVHQLYEGRDELSPRMQEKVHALTQNASTTQEKIDILYRYMQENMRYVSVQLGIGGWQPFDANYVSEKGYGDCKALSNFMKSMLKEIDIEAYPVLIYSGDAPYEIEDDFTSPAFNHVILTVPEADYWLECTSSSFPPNYLGGDNSNKRVLLITEAGGEIVTTPPLPPAENREKRITDVRLAEDGSATMSVKGTYRGESHEIWRSVASALSGSDREKFFQKYYAFPSATLDHLEINPAQDQPTCELDFALKMRRFGSKAGKRLFIPINLVNAHEKIPKLVENRRTPIVLRLGYVEEDQVTIHLPEGYEVESIPGQSDGVRSSFGEYTIKITQEGNQLTYHRSLQVNPIQLPATAYDEFRNFWQAIAKLDDMKVVLVEKKT